jgi:hypothetical protein
MSACLSCTGLSCMHTHVTRIIPCFCLWRGGVLIPSKIQTIFTFGSFSCSAWLLIILFYSTDFVGGLQHSPFKISQWNLRTCTLTIDLDLWAKSMSLPFIIFRACALKPNSCTLNNFFIFQAIASIIFHTWSRKRTLQNSYLRF